MSGWTVSKRIAVWLLLTFLACVDVGLTIVAAFYFAEATNDGTVFMSIVLAGGALFLVLVVWSLVPLFWRSTPGLKIFGLAFMGFMLLFPLLTP